MKNKEHLAGIKDYYNKSTQAWIDSYRRTQSFRFHQFLEEHDNILKSKIFKQGSVYLDAGCGDFSFSIKMAKQNKKIQIHGVTISDKQIKLAKLKCTKNSFITLQNFEKLNFPDNTFDGCYFLESFSHSLNKDKACKEIRRVVKPGGYLYILDLNIQDKVRKDKTYWGWYNIFYYLPISYYQSLKLFKRYFTIQESSTNLRNYRKDLYKRLRSNVNFNNCECTYTDNKSVTDYGVHHSDQAKFNLPVVWSEFIMVNNK
jgi:ubiquinone/menaquinone biosynthesis C-methylase UbiE